MSADLDAVLIGEADEALTVVERVITAGQYAIDTEFHRERTYFPQLALIQIQVDDSIFLIDPLAFDIRVMRPMFESDAVAVLHAARQDLEVLEHAVGAAPRRLWDTQLAAGFLGLSTPSLSSLLESELGVRVPKADRLTDWMRRPLSERQRNYAAADVANLRELHRRQSAELTARSRMGWLTEALDELQAEYRGPRDPLEAWRRIKEARHLRGADLAIAQDLAAWRERRAQHLDLTPRYVLADLALVGLAVAKPTGADQLKDIRGVDQRALRPVVDELIEVIATAADKRPRRDRGPVNNELPAAMRPAVPLVSAWVAQLAKNQQIDPALLATRSDLEAFLRGDAESRLLSGWRGDLVGTPLRRLVSGEVSLALDPAEGLVLERRSGDRA
ncbi:MAG: HRDC domain-containing protein [Microthrixaceae bacterium]|nr:HRDC domain-containing protein [Microthrixaceae bacterium]MCO5312869.1 HRDC domain-containing protein [Microthrixaceae bacterium]